jgi:hypothetical protein
MNVIVRTSLLVAAAALASACTSTDNPWWAQNNSNYYTTPSGSHTSPTYPMATPPAGVPDKVEGSQAPAVSGPTS